MKFALVSLGLFLFATTCRAKPTSPNTLKRQTVQVYVPAVHGAGTGVILDKHRILTANHILKWGTEVVITYHNGFALLGEVLERDEVLDLAIVKVEKQPKGVRAIAVNTQEPEVGSTVFLMGHPMGHSFSFGRGYVMAIEQGHFTALIEFAGPIAPGYSGSGLFNEKGEVIGIALQRLGDTDVGYAIPIGAVCRKLIDCPKAGEEKKDEADSLPPGPENR